MVTCPITQQGELNKLNKLYQSFDDNAVSCAKDLLKGLVLNELSTTSSSSSSDLTCGSYNYKLSYQKVNPDEADKTVIFSVSGDQIQYKIGVKGILTNFSSVSSVLSNRINTTIVNSQGNMNLTDTENSFKFSPQEMLEILNSDQPGKDLKTPGDRISTIVDLLVPVPGRELNYSFVTMHSNYIDLAENQIGLDHAQNNETISFRVEHHSQYLLKEDQHVSAEMRHALFTNYTNAQIADIVAVLQPVVQANNYTNMVAEALQALMVSNSTIKKAVMSSLIANNATAAQNALHTMLTLADGTLSINLDQFMSELSSSFNELAPGANLTGTMPNLFLEYTGRPPQNLDLSDEDKTALLNSVTISDDTKLFRNIDFNDIEPLINNMIACLSEELNTSKLLPLIETACGIYHGIAPFFTAALSKLTGSVVELPPEIANLKNVSLDLCSTIMAINSTNTIFDQLMRDNVVELFKDVTDLFFGTFEPRSSIAGQCVDPYAAEKAFWQD